VIKNKKNKKLKVVLSATSDPATDQRLNKVADSLYSAGFLPVQIGIKRKGEQKTHARIYPVKEFRILFDKGPLFYAEFNIRLFFHLLFSRQDILNANDLDSLLANYLVYKIKSIFNKDIRLVYDSHELFTELPELNGRIKTKKIWLSIEKWILPKIRNAYTVCGSIAEYYHNKYGLKMEIIRNMPRLSSSIENQVKLEIKLPENRKIILYQGALNIGRGIEQVIDLIPFLENVIFVIAGTGTIENSLKEKVLKKGLTEKVIFTGKLPFESLNLLTTKAHLGLVLQDNISLSYHYVLPNRLFDFIKAGVPVIASDLPEIRKIVNAAKIGLLVSGPEDSELLDKIKYLLFDENLRIELIDSMKVCSKNYNWENEERKLLELYKNLR
jgi:glycosyltransferase involved in cell wall biosynthesis